MAMQSAQEAANEEEKSSAGDKYETSRAMSHLQKDMYAKQQEENKLELSRLQLINWEHLYNEVAPGALVSADNNLFFIAAGLGKHIVDGVIIYFLSPNAPLAKLLQHRKKGDIIKFNEQEIKIEMVV